jgi:magnesium-protoporphyrin O-methyltransferase
METASYQLVRDRLEEYFDRTAVDAWAQLTSDRPVGRIRATVRAGRDRMRATLLDYLPADLSGQRLLDAGCGTGALAVEAARRGADVVAIDLSPTLVRLAQERVPPQLGAGRIDFRASDMLDPALGRFDWVVAMDSVIHYQAADLAEMVARLCARATRGMVFTFAPRTPLLAAMHAVGKLFPADNRSPAIQPIAERDLRARLSEHALLRAGGVKLGRSDRIDSAFYISQAMELVRS